jgi:hypothetical protein
MDPLSAAILAVAVVLLVAALATVIGIVIYNGTRDLRDVRIERFEVSPDVVCQGDACPIRIVYRVTNLGQDQSVFLSLRFGSAAVPTDDGQRIISQTPQADLALFPNPQNFPEGSGQFTVSLTVTDDVVGRRRIIAIERRGLFLMEGTENAFRLNYSASNQNDSANILSDTRTIGDAEFANQQRVPGSVVRFCKNSALNGIALERANVSMIGGQPVGQDSSNTFSTIEVTINDTDSFSVNVGQTLSFPNPLPLDNGIRITSAIKPPEGQAEWPTPSSANWTIATFMQCPT